MKPAENAFRGQADVGINMNQLTTVTNDLFTQSLRHYAKINVPPGSITQQKFCSQSRNGSSWRNNFEKCSLIVAIQLGHHFHEYFTTSHFDSPICSDLYFSQFVNIQDRTVR